MASIRARPCRCEAVSSSGTQRSCAPRKRAVKTSRGIRLGSNYAAVVSKYGFPERTRKIPGGRFDESYYTRNYHCAFTEDTLGANRVVRITVTLAD